MQPVEKKTLVFVAILDSKLVLSVSLNAGLFFNRPLILNGGSKIQFICSKNSSKSFSSAASLSLESIDEATGGKKTIILNYKFTFASWLSIRLTLSVSTVEAT